MMIAWLSIVAASAAVVYLLVLLIKVLLACRIIGVQRRYLGTMQAHRQAEGIDTERALGSITIIQPILSGDPLLSKQLATNLRHLPDSVCFVWLVDDSDVEGRRIADDLAASFFNGVVKLCPDAPPDVNPKTFKLSQIQDQITTEFMAILDDDTTVQTPALMAAFDHLETCDLYTGLPRYRAYAGLGNQLLAHFVNNNAVVTYLPMLNFAPPVSINGMFYVMRVEPWLKLGGFSPLLHELCDDYAVHQQAVRHGWRIAQGITPQQVQTSVRGTAHYCSLMHRWMLFATLLVRDQTIAMQALLFVSLGLPPVLLLLAICGILTSWYVFAIVAVTLCLRHLLLVSVHRVAFGSRSQLSVGYSLFAELLQPLHALHAMCVRSIRWRCRTIRVDAHNRFQIEQEAAT